MDNSSSGCVQYCAAGIARLRRPNYRWKPHQRIANGNAEDVYRDINENLTLVQRMKDLGQIVLTRLTWWVRGWLAGRPTSRRRVWNLHAGLSQYADEIIDGCA